MVTPRIDFWGLLMDASVSLSVSETIVGEFFLKAIIYILEG